MAQFDCPHCGHSQRVDDKYLGKEAACPKCKTRSEVVSSAFVMPPSPSSWSSPSRSPSPPAYELLSAPGGAKELVLNKKSSLRRECQAIQHDSLPLQFIRAPIVTASRISGSDSRVSYEAHVEVECVHAALRAVEIRYLIFNVWGEHMHTLAALEVEDMPPHSAHRFDHRWDPFLPADMDEYFSSLAFVARVLDSENNVTEVDSNVVVEAARTIASRFNASDVEPRNQSASK